ncbi:MAG: S8 family serine peptidase, partial [Actinobacteria bacterium]|nr:S8 family serine peptidase [Actinomycetota bacterium]
PDLAANMWHNPDEDAPDRHGVNFVGNTPDPMDDNHHGSHVAGTIAAEGNNGRGVVGVNWQGRLMALKFLSNKGRGSTADAIRSVLYASAHGARLTNNSWGGGGFNEALQDALRASPALHLVAAGNDFSDNDRNPRYPASYLLDNMVVVAASDRRDEKASFSNWGRRTVDLAAPGEGIYSTTPGNTYETLSGTSMATPHVAGVAALIASQYPGISNAQIKARLTHSVDHVEALRPLVISGGRLNAFRALENDTVAPAAPGDLRGLQAGISTATVGWTASGDDGRAGTASTYELRFSEAPLDEGNFAAATRVDARWPSPAGTAERADVELVPSAQPRTLHVGLKVYDNVGNASGLVTALVNVPAARVVFEDKMENGTANWSPEIPWGLVDEAAHGKVWASSPNGLQDNAANTSLLSRPIDLGGVRNPQLIFNARWDLEKGYDFLNVELSDDAGKTWTVLGRHTFSTDWHKEMHDLFAWQGKQVVVRFRVETDRSVQSRGVRLDDVVVAGSGAQK